MPEAQPPGNVPATGNGLTTAEISTHALALWTRLTSFGEVTNNFANFQWLRPVTKLVKLMTRVSTSTHEDMAKPRNLWSGIVGFYSLTDFSGQLHWEQFARSVTPPRRDERRLKILYFYTWILAYYTHYHYDGSDEYLVDARSALEAMCRSWNGTMSRQFLLQAVRVCKSRKWKELSGRIRYMFAEPQEIKAMWETVRDS
ncbi:hypothetical protein P154DRAFT_597833 [Amniculicola lignicola CBS 123094]|uniref:Uncharacterized protein n=1 Tax=Amniculicola lignicola CBS 123094 TaxID=1392246 RepID=A0A6A5WJX4_9PLEO|nr:hypothetical protein P154DRAFT_597833 [Amniculicola lignicola CBS 123094]